ncbi:MAG TPA: aminoacyl-tRNA hydrolase [Candidatus Methylomirabilis sp.]|nr:aminoacyl-tRNA hydrolase [Candidatus Methylomirabilis sp.]
MRIIVGLGNPGQEYENTRHNAGFMLVDKLAHDAGATWQFNKRFKAEIAESRGVFFVKPQTFMNESGMAVAAVLSYYKLLPRAFGILKTKGADLSQILTVAHDDLDIDFGTYKISTDSRSAGHKGVQSIIDHLKTKNFRRIRLGIKTEVKSQIPADKFVLMKFSPEEKEKIQKLIENINI